MYLTVSKEMSEFLLAQGTAILMGILFDFLKGVKPKKMSKTASGFFDLTCWLVLSVIFCVLWRDFFAGEFRWHTVLGLILTLILYFLTIHKPIFTAYCIIIKKISFFLGTIFKFLLTVKAFLGKIIVCLSVFLKRIYSAD